MIFEINNNGTISKIFSNTWSPDANSWYHVAVSRKNGIFNFYLNGVAHGEDYNYKAISIPNIGSNLEIGHLSGANYFDGQIDEFRIWNVARSVSEIYFKTENILERTSGLIGEYRFDGSLEDASLSYNDGSLSEPLFVADDDSITDPVNKHKIRLRLNSTDVTFTDYYYDRDLDNPSVGSGTAIGGRIGDTTYPWRGDIAEVIIFDRVLTYEEIGTRNLSKKKMGHY